MKRGFLLFDSKSKSKKNMETTHSCEVQSASPNPCSSSKATAAPSNAQAKKNTKPKSEVVTPFSVEELGGTVSSEEGESDSVIAISRDDAKKFQVKITNEQILLFYGEDEDSEDDSDKFPDIHISDDEQ